MGFAIRFRYGRLVCASVLLLSGSAAAQTIDRAAAEALFEKGRQAMGSGDYDGACADFEESNRLDPAPGTMANLASCEEKRGHLSSAWQWFEEVEAKLAPDDPRRQYTADRAAALKARLAVLTIRLAPGSPADSKVQRDSVELHRASLGVALPVDPGAHRVTVSVPGRVDKHYAVMLAEKESRDLIVAPSPAPEPAPAPTPAMAPSLPHTETPPNLTPEPARAPPQDAVTSPSSNGSARTAGYVIGGVGVAGIGTALVLGGLVLEKKSAVWTHCDATTRVCDQTGLDAARAGSRLSTISTISFVAGAVAAGVGAYLVITNPSEPKTTVGAIGVPGGGFLQLTSEY